MRRIERIHHLLVGLGMIVAAGIMLLFPENGYLIIGSILSLILIATGIRNLNYYRTMARHMVGGRQVLYMGILLLDMGLFLGGLASVNPIYVMLYLLGGYALSGLVHILRAFEAKEYSTLRWFSAFSLGIFDIAIAGLGLYFLHSTKIMVLIYSIGLIHSAAIRIRSAFRRNDIVYIQ